jgi:hypothetical protein
MAQTSRKELAELALKPSMTKALRLYFIIATDIDTEAKYNMFQIENVITETGSVDRWKAAPGSYQHVKR